MRNRALVVAAGIVGVLLLVVAVIYWVDAASSLPSFFPGHDAASSHHHVKHGIAALVVALGCFVFAWFATGPAGQRARST
jgi:ABC-type transporter Mla subunit MlaD